MTMTKLNFTIQQKENDREQKVFGVLSLLFSIAGLLFLPLSILGIIFGHLASNKKNKPSSNIYAKSGLIISYGWLMFSVVSIIIYILLK